jgi:dihydrofolate reductase
MYTTLFMAMSVNGYIATKNGREDFLSHDNWNELVRLANEAGCLVWGRKTYEKVLEWGTEYLNPLQSVEKIILSKKSTTTYQGCEVASSPESALDIAEKRGFDKLLISGGATINTAFAKAGLVDRLIINIESVMIGDGVGIFSPSAFLLPLTFINSRRISPTIQQHTYEIVR